MLFPEYAGEQRLSHAVDTHGFGLGPAGRAADICAIPTMTSAKLALPTRGSWCLHPMLGEDNSVLTKPRAGSAGEFELSGRCD
jgi:uncharacterized protein YjlB